MEHWKFPWNTLATKKTFFYKLRERAIPIFGNVANEGWNVKGGGRQKTGKAKKPRKYFPLFLTMFLKWNFSFYLKCPSKLFHLVSSMGSQRIMNYVCSITDAIDFEANLHHSPKTCKFIKIAEKFKIKLANFKKFASFGRILKVWFKINYICNSANVNSWFFENPWSLPDEIAWKDSWGKIRSFI